MDDLELTFILSLTITGNINNLLCICRIKFYLQLMKVRFLQFQ